MKQAARCTGAAALWACGAFAAHPESISMSPGQVHEACKLMAAGEQWRYDFSADDKLEFNVHYHVGDAVIYPVGPLAANMKAGVVNAELDQTYCLMWRNTAGEPIQLRIAEP